MAECLDVGNQVVNLMTEFVLAGNNLLDLGIENININDLACVLLLNVAVDGEVVTIVGDVGIADECGTVRRVGAGDVPLHDMPDILRHEFVLVALVLELLGGINEQRLVVALVLLEDDDAGGNADAEEEIGGELDDGVDIVEIGRAHV